MLALFLVLSALPLPAPMPGDCLDPDIRTDGGIRAIDNGEPCKRRAPSPKMSGAAPAALQQAIRRFNNLRMLDGPSARYIWPTHRERAGFYCGFVNAKNGMGGYTGYRRFLATYTLPGYKIRDVTLNEVVVDALCDAQGYRARP